MKIRTIGEEWSLYSVVQERIGDRLHCITIGRYACYINTPKKLCYNKSAELPVGIKKLLNDVLCK